MSTARNTNDPEVLRGLLSDLEVELKEKTTENSAFEAEIRSLQRKLTKRDAEILRQERELHKLRVSARNDSCQVTSCNRVSLSL